MNLEQFYRGKKILITGSTGFKGSWLSVFLLGLGAKVYGFSKATPSHPSMFNILSLDKHIESYSGDITDFEKLSTTINSIKPDVIFHLAAQALVNKGISQPLQTFQSNVWGSANVFEALRRLEQPCFLVNVSSDKCYLNKEWVWGYRESDELGGKDPYSASKAAVEVIFKSYYETYFSREREKKVVSARAGNVIGGGDWGENRLVPDCVRAWKKSSVVELRNPNSIRPWQHVLDAVYGYVLLPVKLKDNPALSGEAFNFGPNLNNNISVRQLVESLALYFQNAGYDALTTISQDYKTIEAVRLKLSCEKSNELIGWKPTLGFEKVAEFTAKWYIYEGSENVNMFQFTESQISEFLQLQKEKNK